MWLAEEARIAPTAIAAVEDALERSAVLRVSPISAWEIGNLGRKGRLRTAKRAEVWFDDFMARPGVEIAPMPVSILIGSSFLPGSPPADPADRIIAATAREFGYTIVTRDRALLAYAGAGHINAIEC